MCLLDRLAVLATLVLYAAGGACVAEYVFGRNQLLVGIGTLAVMAVGVLGTRAIANEAVRREGKE